MGLWRWFGVTRGAWNRLSDTLNQISAANSTSLLGGQPVVPNQALRRFHPYPGREVAVTLN